MTRELPIVWLADLLGDNLPSVRCVRHGRHGLADVRQIRFSSTVHFESKSSLMGRHASRLASQRVDRRFKEVADQQGAFHQPS